MEYKLTIRINQRINAIMNALDKALMKEHNSDQEFCGLLIAPKANPWMCEDMVIPKQKVTGTSVDLPKEGKYSPYQRFFEAYIEKSKTHVIIGTIHSHNDMDTFFSGGDDDDLDNNAFLNLNENLPFIDIVWSHKENDYKARVRLKIGKGESKQIFTQEDCEVEITGDKATSKLMDKIKPLLGKNYKIDESLFNKCILPEIDIKGMMENIEVETYSSHWNNDSSDALKEGGDVKIDVNFKKEGKDQILIFTCEGIDTEKFVEVVEDAVRDSVDYQVTSTSFVGGTTTLEIECDSKNKYKKLKHKIFKLRDKFLENGKLEKRVTNNRNTIREQDLDEYDEEMLHYGLYGGAPDITSKNKYPSYLG